MVRKRFGILFIQTFTLIGCTSKSEQVGTDNISQQEVDMLQGEVEELQQEVKFQWEENKSIQDELSAYKSFVRNDLVYHLDSQQLQTLAESQWEYQLFIDNKQINEANNIHSYY